MNIEVYIFAGFMDSGKTTALQGILVGSETLPEQRSLIICTEDGETEYVESILNQKNIEVVHVENEGDLTAEYMQELVLKHDASIVYIEFNGMWDLRAFLQEQIPDDWIVASIFSLVDAQTYDMYLNNMRQIVMNPLSVSDVILFNRCPDAIKKGEIRRSLKILNNRAQVHFARMDGSIDNNLDELLLPDENGVIEIDDKLFCSWFVDTIENSDRYYGKKIHTQVMVSNGKGLAANQFYAGRMAAICCAEDAQFIGFVAQCHGYVPKNGTWLDIVATIQKGEIDNNRAILLLEIEDACELEAPADIYLYF